VRVLCNENVRETPITTATIEFVRRSSVSRRTRCIQDETFTESRSRFSKQHTRMEKKPPYNVLFAFVSELTRVLEENRIPYDANDSSERNLITRGRREDANIIFILVRPTECITNRSDSFEQIHYTCLQFVCAQHDTIYQTRLNFVGMLKSNRITSLSNVLRPMSDTV